MAYKMIALDMDGTLLNSNLEMTKKTIDYLKRCMESGIKVVLSSGREYNAIEKYSDILGIRDYQIALNGSVIFDPVEYKSVAEYSIDKDIYMGLINRLDESGYPYVVYDNRDYYNDSKELNGQFADLMKRVTGIEGIKVDSYHKINIPTKILLGIEDKNLVKDVQKQFMDEAELKTLISGDHIIEIVRDDVNKGVALKYLAEQYGIKREEIIAFGDSENDIDMLTFAGTGVAMGNAFEHVKSISDFVTKSNDEDGIVYALDKYLSI